MPGHGAGAVADIVQRLSAIAPAHGRLGDPSIRSHSVDCSEVSIGNFHLAKECHRVQNLQIGAEQAKDLGFRRSLAEAKAHPYLG